MKLEHKILRLCRMFLVLGGALGAAGALVMGLAVYLAGRTPNPSQVNAGAPACGPAPTCGPIQYKIEPQPLPHQATPPVEPVVAPQTVTGATAVAGRVASPEKANGTISDTLTVTASRAVPAPPTLVVTSTMTPPEMAVSEIKAEESYTSTAQVQPRSGPGSGEVMSEPATLPDQTLSPDKIACPDTSSASFDLISIPGPPADRPDFAHADLNITLRGYAPVPEPLKLVLFDGATDPDAPQLAGLFQPNRVPVIKSVYRVNHWMWEAGWCGGSAQGCAGPLIDDWDVTLVGLATRPGEAISLPERDAQIYQGGYKAVVLYAEARQITLGYARRDTVASGYVVHILDVCVDPNLLALYRAQNSEDGRRVTGLLPALRNDQILGTAWGDQIKVAVRDKGSFMDPRSRKDWWRGY